MKKPPWRFPFLISAGNRRPPGRLITAGDRSSPPGTANYAFPPAVRGQRDQPQRSRGGQPRCPVPGQPRMGPAGAPPGTPKLGGS